MRAHGIDVILPDVAAILLCAVAVVVDVRSYRIPNRLTLYGAVAGLALNALVGLAIGGSRVGLSAGGDAIAGGAFLLVVTGVLGALRLLGMGDVKLLGAVGLCVRWPLALHVLVYTTLAGGVIALGIALRRGNLPRVVGNIASSASRSARPLHRMPYAVAIFAGTCWAIAARYLPELKLI